MPPKHVPFRMVSDFDARGRPARRPSPRSAPGIGNGERFQTLLGITGSGKSATIAWTIEQVQQPDAGHRAQQVAGRPAGQRVPRVLPRQPGRVLRLATTTTTSPRPTSPSSDTYIEKDSSVNDEIDRLRHSATVGAAHPARRHRGRLGVVHLRPRLARGVPATSCSSCSAGEEHDQRADPAPAGRHAVRAQRHEPRAGQVPGAGRHHRGPPRLRRDAPCASSCSATRSSASPWSTRSPASSVDDARRARRLPGHPLRRRRGADAARPSSASRPSCRSGWPSSRSEGKLLEAQRLRMRTQYDLEMMQEVGFCNGIENYSAPIDGRGPGEPPVHAARLLPRRLPARHRRVPRHRPAAARPVRGRPQSRKETLIEHGFRLPSAADNRPLRFEEFVERVNQVRLPVGHARPLRAASISRQVVEQIVRPTGLVDPEVIVKPDQGPDRRPASSRSTSGSPAATACSSPRSPRRWPRTSPTTCSSMGVRVRYLHSEHRHHPAHRDPARPAARRVRRARRHQPAAGGPRPARGVARRHPRRRQGGLPPQRDVAHPDDRPGRPQRRRPGGHVRRQGHRLDAAGHLARPTAAGGCSWRTTPSTASTRRRSARRSPTSSPTCARPRRRAGAGRGPPPRPRATGKRARRAGRPAARASSAGSSSTLEEEMHEAAADLRFEYAARLRDEIKDLKRELREAGGSERRPQPVVAGTVGSAGAIREPARSDAGRRRRHPAPSDVTPVPIARSLSGAVGRPRLWRARCRSTRPSRAAPVGTRAAIAEASAAAVPSARGPGALRRAIRAPTVAAGQHGCRRPGGRPGRSTPGRGSRSPTTARRPRPHRWRAQVGRAADARRLPPVARRPTADMRRRVTGVDARSTVAEPLGHVRVARSARRGSGARASRPPVPARPGRPSSTRLGRARWPRREDPVAAARASDADRAAVADDGGGGSGSTAAVGRAPAHAATGRGG